VHHRLAVTYLFNRACPSHEEGLELLRAAAAAAGAEIDVRVVEVVDDDAAAALRFPGSPTYRAGGRDLFPHADQGHGFLADACRPYERPGGRVGPLPHRDDLVAALRAAAGRAS
jgi:hypothetical protein